MGHVFTRDNNFEDENNMKENPKKPAWFRAQVFKVNGKKRNHFSSVRDEEDEIPDIEPEEDPDNSGSEEEELNYYSVGGERYND